MSNTITIDMDTLTTWIVKMLRDSLGYSNIQIRRFADEAERSLSRGKNTSRIYNHQLVNDLTSAETEALIASLRNAGIPDPIIELTIPSIRVRSYEEMGEYLSDLLKSHEVTENDVEAGTGVDAGYLRQVTNKKSGISKETVFAVSLFLNLSMDEVEEFMAVDGMHLGNSIADMYFKAFILSENYDVTEYVAQCKKAAEASGERLPKFFYRDGRIV